MFFNYGWILHMVSKLSENGVAGFILANGALSGDGTEKAIRQKLVENGLIEAIIILPMKMFYTTDISVTLWIINKNKKERIVPHEDLTRHYRNREDKCLLFQKYFCRARTFLVLIFVGCAFEDFEILS